jgi:hypothetical protein
MTTALTTTGTHKAIATTGNDPFCAFADAIAPKHILGDLLKFNKGDYLAGETAETIPVGTKVTVGMDLLLVGWVRWENGKPIEHRMVRVADGKSPQRRAELGDDDRSLWEIDSQGKPRDPWALTQYVPAIDESGDLFTFCTTSRGGINALADLSRYYGRNRHAHPDEFPVVELSVETYQHSNPQFGRIKVPSFKPVGWSLKHDFWDTIGTEVPSTPAASGADEMSDPIPF